jgi:hypothetical protein
MAVQHNVINGICAGRRWVNCASHLEAMPSARDSVGRDRGRQRGVRSVLPSSDDNNDDDNGDDDNGANVDARVVG